MSSLSSAEEISQSMIETMFSILDRAREELLFTNAYIIPGQLAIEFLEKLDDLINAGADSTKMATCTG